MPHIATVEPVVQPLVLWTAFELMACLSIRCSSACLYIGYHKNTAFHLEDLNTGAGPVHSVPQRSWGVKSAVLSI